MDDKRGQEDIAAKKLQQTAVRGGLNYVSGGQYEKIRNAPVVGNAAKKVEDVAANKLNNITSKTPLNKPIRKTAKKLDDVGALDTLNKGMSALGGKNPKKDDIANQKLRNVKNTKGGRLNNFLRRSNSGGETSSEMDDSENSDDENTVDEVISRKSLIRLLVSIASMFIPLLLFIPIILILIIVIIMPSNFFKPLLSVFEYESTGNKDYYLVNVDDSANKTNEMSYYSKLESVKGSYIKKCEEECKKKKISNCIINLNNNYVHAALIYLYYQVDYEKDFSPEEVHVNYAKMSSMIGTVYELMAGESCDVDYSVGGDFYNKLLNSSDFKNYYSDLLKEDSMENILNVIFELAENINIENDYSPDIVISSKLKVNYNGLDINAKDYLTGVIYNKLDKEDLSNAEVVKAYTIYYTNNTIYKGDLSKNNLKVSINGNDYCDINSNCNGKGKITETEKNTIKNSIDAVYGNVLLNESGNIAYLNNDLSSSGNYKTILAASYPNYQVKNLLENTYDDGANYGNDKILTKAIFYDQNDYGNVAFCGRSNASIKSSGCGTTAMAIIVSTYENSNKYDPVYEMNRAYKWGYCGKGISGTNVGFFKKEAKSMGYKYLKVGKSKASDLNLVLSHLAKGDLVIAHMGPGHFTSGGHYMVLGGVDPSNKKVYVYDPYNKANKANKKRKTGNGWYSLNDMIAKEAFAFYIIWKG